MDTECFLTMLTGDIVRTSRLALVLWLQFLTHLLPLLVLPSCLPVRVIRTPGLVTNNLIAAAD